MRAVARQVHVTLVDDLDGSPASETVIFGLDGRHYEVDLSEKNAARLRDGLSRFLDAARGAGSGGHGRRRRSSSTSTAAQPGRSSGGREHNAAVREWARQHGHAISAHGRLPRSVLEAYRNEVG
jgi:Lsr2